MSEGVDESKRATLKRFAAVGAATPLARLSGDDAGNSDARDAIVGYLSTTPGAHFSKVRDDLQLGTGETQHHLRRLERAGAVESRKDGDYRRYFPSGQFTEFEQRALGYLRRDTARGMIVMLLRTPDATGTDLASALGVSQPTISKYAAELQAANLLSRDTGYQVKRPETLLILVVRYADSFDGDAMALAADADSLVSYDL